MIAVSSRALFNLEAENRIFEEEGLSAYSKYQIEHEDDILEPGTGFELVKALLQLNEIGSNRRRVEVLIMSRNSADTGLRVFNSIEKYELDITRAAFTGGRPVAKYLEVFNIDLFLSADENDVKEALNAGIAAGLIYSPPPKDKTDLHNPVINEIRIAFDGDAVIFSDESEKIYQEKGIETFSRHEKENAERPLQSGPFTKFLTSLFHLQNEVKEGGTPIRIALVTARCSPAHVRVIKTLRAWNVRIDETFFLGGWPKENVLKTFGAHIYFDDQDGYCRRASKVVPTARVSSSLPSLVQDE